MKFLFPTTPFPPKTHMPHFKDIKMTTSNSLLAATIVVALVLGACYYVISFVSKPTSPCDYPRLPSNYASHANTNQLRSPSWNYSGRLHRFRFMTSMSGPIIQYYTDHFAMAPTMLPWGSESLIGIRGLRWTLTFSAITTARYPSCTRLKPSASRSERVPWLKRRASKRSKSSLSF